MYEHKIYTDKEIKDLVIKAYEKEIFTSFQCDKENLASVFMPILFIRSQPTEPRDPVLIKGDDIKEERKNKLDHIDEKKQWEIDMKHYNDVTYPEWEKNELPLLNAFIGDIGMIFEYMSKALPTGINGYPIFTSCGFLRKEDAQKFINKYKIYEEKLNKIKEKV